MFILAGENVLNRTEVATRNGHWMLDQVSKTRGREYTTPNPIQAVDSPMEAVCS